MEYTGQWYERTVTGSRGAGRYDHAAISFAYADADGSIVRWELEGSEGKTFLTFVQSGYTDDEWDNAAQHEAGWLGSLAELKRSRNG